MQSQPMAQFDPTQPLQRPKKHFNVLLLPLILAAVFLVIALGFGIWAFSGREDYKNNADRKISAAVAVAEKKLSDEKEAEFLEREKQPLKTFEGPATFGSLKISYPKTWSAFITQSDKAAIPIDGYLHPDVVPGLQSGTAYALHFQVTSVTYDQELKKFEGDTKSGKVKVSPVTAPKVSGVAGVRITGEVERGKQGTLVMFPLRDKTLKIITESEQFNKDFDQIILSNLVFVP